MGSKNLDAAKRVLDGYNKRDWDHGLKGVAPNGVFTEIPTGASFQGHDGYRQAYENWSRAFGDSQLTDMEWDDAGDHIYCRHTFTGTNTGEMGGAPPTGRPVKFSCVQHFRCEKGKVVSQQVYFDALTMMTQLGHVSLPN